MFCWCVLAVQVEEELKSICDDILQVLDEHLIPSADTGESRVFYYKMYACFAFTTALHFHVATV